jgi:hypothetical protein
MEDIFYNHIDFLRGKENQINIDLVLSMYEQGDR